MISVDQSTRPLRVKTITFGCKVNLSDTVLLESRLERDERYQVQRDLSESPDIVVVNTCTVTHGADREARQTLRRIHRSYPEARIIVTGCYASQAGELLRSFSGVSDVIPASRPDLLGKVLSLDPEDDGLIERFAQRSRAFLKMQDGCNAYCSFCILPYVRGRSRSYPMETILKQAETFAQSGYTEIVLTGTHLGAFGRDLTPRTRLSDAMTKLFQTCPDTSFRVSSLEPTGLTRDFLKLVRSSDQVQPHFHIPLQSGSDAVLRRMNRKYYVHNFRDRILELSFSRKNMSIGADVIVGFPGETEKEFQETVDLVLSLPLTYLHVFPYSPRPGTKASNEKDSVDQRVKKERSAVLREISSNKKGEFYKRFLHRTEKVLVENERDEFGNLKGLTPHYVRVRFQGPDRLLDRCVEVRMTQYDPKDECLVGEVMIDEFR